MLGLQNFTRANGIGGHRDCPANIRSRKAGRQGQRAGKQAIAEQNRDLVAPIAGQRQPPPANFGFIHDIVVDEGSQVNNLNNYGNGEMIIIQRAEGVGGKGHQCGAQLLALTFQRVIGVRGHFGIESLNLPGQSPTDGVKKRLDRLNNLLPEMARLGAQRARYCRRHHFGISR